MHSSGNSYIEFTILPSDFVWTELLSIIHSIYTNKWMRIFIIIDFFSTTFFYIGPWFACVFVRKWGKWSPSRRLIKLYLKERQQREQAGGILLYFSLVPYMMFRTGQFSAHNKCPCYPNIFSFSLFQNNAICGWDCLCGSW